MGTSDNTDKSMHIPDEGVIDDRGTIDSQLPAVPKESTVPHAIAQQLMQYLKNAKYPATKKELYAFAARSGAPKSQLSHLRSMERNVFDSAADVQNELAVLPNLS